MNKKEFREHCKRQIEHCIKFHDEKHLKEHELSLALLNECEVRKEEKEQLKEQNEQKDNAIDECIELVNQWKNFCNSNCEEETYDIISIQNNVYWKDCIGHLNYLLEKIQQAKGDNSE